MAYAPTHEISSASWRRPAYRGDSDLRKAGAGAHGIFAQMPIDRSAADAEGARDLRQGVLA